VTVRTNRMLSWKKAVGKNAHRFGIFQKPVALVKTDAVPMVNYNKSHETGDALTRASLGRAVGAILLKGAQMSQ
jgi:hypothetical protein